MDTFHGNLVKFGIKPNTLQSNTLCYSNTSYSGQNVVVVNKRIGTVLPRFQNRTLLQGFHGFVIRNLDGCFGERRS